MSGFLEIKGGGLNSFSWNHRIDSKIQFAWICGSGGVWHQTVGEFATSKVNDAWNFGRKIISTVLMSTTNDSI